MLRFAFFGETSVQVGVLIIVFVVQLVTVRVGTPIHIGTKLRAVVCAMSVHIIPVHDFPVWFPVWFPVHVHVLPVKLGSRNFVVVR